MLSTTKLQWPCDKNCSHYRAPIQDLTSQSQELCVKDQLLKFQLDPTVNEVGTFILRKVYNVEKKSSATSIKHTHSRTKITTLYFKEKGFLASLTWSELTKDFDTKQRNTTNLGTDSRGGQKNGWANVKKAKVQTLAEGGCSSKRWEEVAFLKNEWNEMVRAV